MQRVPLSGVFASQIMVRRIVSCSSESSWFSEGCDDSSMGSFIVPDTTDDEEEIKSRTSSSDSEEDDDERTEEGNLHVARTFVAGGLPCSKCYQILHKDSFSRAQQKALDDDRYCLAHSTASAFNAKAVYSSGRKTGRYADD